MKEMLIFMVVAFFALFLLWLIYQKQIHRRLAKHQKEWDNIKIKMKLSGASQSEIYDAYVDFIDRLDFECQDRIGSCYPHI